MTSIVFPGQGSQFIGMSKDFYDNFSISRAVLEEIEESTKLQLKKIIFEDPDNLLNLTQYTQICTFAASVMIFKALESSYLDNSKIDVISDFRNFDIKNGGMGAPLIPKFHQYLFGSENSKKIIFNIGGIANGTYLDNKKIMLASDVGPGNCLMDLVATKRLDSNFDLNGETASKGKIIESLLKMLHASCVHLDYPRADDKQDYYKIFNTNFDKYQTEDILRTLAEFTAEKIKEFYDFCNRPEEIIFHGGGTMNIFLMELIKDKLGVEIKTTDNEIPSKFVEAAAFAYLAFLEKGEIFEPK